MKHRLWPWMLACAWAWAQAQASDRLADHAAVAPLLLQSADGVQRAQLPLALLQAARSPGLADLAVFNAQGERLPHALVPAHRATQQREAALPMFAWPQQAAAPARGGVQVRVDTQGAVLRIEGPGAAVSPGPPTHEWLLDSGAVRPGERLSALKLTWPVAETGLTRQATLEGSEDLVDWRPLASSPLVDLPGPDGLRVLRNELRLDSSAPRYLRLRLDAPLALQQVMAQWQAQQGEAMDSAEFAFRKTVEGGTTAWQADLQAPLALRRIAVHLPQDNTVLQAWLEQRDDAAHPWRTLGRHTLYRLQRDGTALHAPPIEVEAPAARHWRLRLDPQSPGLPAEQVLMQVQWPQAWVAFVARAPLPLQLAAGRERATPAALPLDALLPGYRPGMEWQLPVATVGPVQVRATSSPDLAERLRNATPAEQRRWLLWAVLLATVGVLAWLARGLLKDVSRPTPP